jgi:hypothetical protein
MDGRNAVPSDKQTITGFSAENIMHPKSTTFFIRSHCPFEFKWLVAWGLLSSLWVCARADPDPRSWTPFRSTLGRVYMYLLYENGHGPDK